MNARLQSDIPRYIFGIGAMFISLLLVFQRSLSFPLTVIALYLIVICAIDTMYSKIPNYCNLVLLIVGLTYNVYLTGLIGFGYSLLGLLVGLSLLLVPYLLGGIGGGDVKALAAMGSLLGPGVIFQVFLYVGLIGGILAIVHYLFQGKLIKKTGEAVRALFLFAGTKDAMFIRPKDIEKLRFPYATAIAFGFFFYVEYGEVISLFKGLVT